MADEKTKIEQEKDPVPGQEESSVADVPRPPKKKNNKKTRRKTNANAARREEEKKRRADPACRKQESVLQQEDASHPMPEPASGEAQPEPPVEHEQFPQEAMPVQQEEKASADVVALQASPEKAEDVAPENTESVESEDHCDQARADEKNESDAAKGDKEATSPSAFSENLEHEQAAGLQQTDSKAEDAVPPDSLPQTDGQTVDVPVAEEAEEKESALQEQQAQPEAVEEKPNAEPCAPEDHAQAQMEEENASTEQTEKQGKRSRAGRERKRHCFTFYVAATTGVVLLASALSIFVMFFTTGNPLFTVSKDVELPNFYNMTKEEIEDNPDYSSFRIEFVDVYSDEVAEGHVVDQSPKPPKEVKENANITLRVSKGVEKVEVPDMIGWTRTSASEKVKSINLSILIKYETDENKPYNTVLRTSPKAGTMLEAGDTLTVYINREELAVGWITAPSCVGLSQSEAGRLLTSRGLSYSFIKVDSDSPEGYVVSQSPSAGDGIAQGGSVTLRVSNGLGASGDGVIQDPNVADGSVTGHHHSWIAWQDGHWICTVCGAVK